jgi:WD40 repeat protein
MVSSGALMRRFDVDGELEVTNFIETGQNIRGLVPTPDGLRVITAGDGRLVKIWDMHRGEIETWLYGHTGAIEGIALSPDGARLATVGRDRFLRVWAVRDGEEKDLFRGSASPPYRVAVTADDRVAVSGTHKGIVRLWDVESGCEIRSFYGFGSEVRGVAITRKGDRIAGFGPNGLAVWSTESADPQIRWLVGPGGPGVADAVFSSDGSRLLISGTGDRIWSLWDVEAGREIRGRLRNEGFGTHSVAFTPGEKRCVGALADGALGIWDLKDGREVRRMPVHRATIASLDVSPDGRVSLTGDQNGKIMLWDLATGKVRRAVSDREVSVENVAFLPGGKRFVSSHFDDEVRLWDSETGRERLRVRGRGYKAFWITPLSDGRRFLVCRRSAVLECLDLSWREKYDAFRPRLAKARTRLSANPRDGEALHEFGRWYYFRGAWREAARQLEAARAAGAKISRVMLGNCFWRMRRFDDASVELSAARAGLTDGSGAEADHLSLCLRGLRVSAKNAANAERLTRDAIPAVLGMNQGELREDSPRMGRRNVCSFRVEGEAGRWMIFEMRAKGFDPVCTVIHPDMTMMAFAASGGPRTGRGFMARLPYNGTYLLVVYGVSEKARGTFTLNIYYKQKGE